jgi:vitamin B12 transporter
MLWIIDNGNRLHTPPKIVAGVGAWHGAAFRVLGASLFGVAPCLASPLAFANSPATPTSPARPSPPGPAPFVAEAEAEAKDETTGEEPLAEVTVRVTSAAVQLRHSAEAVQVIEMQGAQRRSADLGETLARSPGVTVQRAGGLGSDTRFGLNGLEGDQVRFFFDGVPLGFAGFSFGFANVPVNFVQRLEIYRGVVPARFGADALGGAVNLVSEGASFDSRWAASYQTGSFDTHRLTLDASHVFSDSGLFVRANAFGDTTANDYPIEVDVANSLGQQSRARVYRFHDGYRAGGVGLEAGRLGRLSVRAFVTASDKDQQHDPLMITPYGEVSSRTRNAGAYIRYRGAWNDALSLSTVAGYAFGRAGLRDLSSCIYDWFGQCPRQRITPGEVENVPRDNVIDNHASYARAQLAWELVPEHRLRLALAPDLILRSGDERRPRSMLGVDPLEAQRVLASNVTGLEYQLDVWDERLSNIVAVKSYLQAARSERPLPAGGVEDQDRNTHALGVAESLRYRLTEGLWSKASYEYATRLPQLDEVFGDGVQIEENVDLAPETSHNLNLGVALDSGASQAGQLFAEANLFYRNARDLIRRVGASVYFSYQNTAAARTLGGDVTVRWVAPAERVVLEGSATYQDTRNRATSGPDAAQRGDRIPNRPYAFGSASLELRQPGLIVPGDVASALWSSRYVHQFYRTWESLGALETKPRVESQLVHSAGLSYAVSAERGRTLTSSVEMQNVADAKTFDFFGVQRPGRAVFFKSTLEL